MERATERTGSIKKPNRQVRFPGICTAAFEIGCTPGHLRYVLKGQRKSHRLMKKWNEWLAKQAEEKAKTQGHMEAQQ